MAGTPTAGAPDEAFDVTRLHDRRSTARWNRMVIGDVFERMTWSTPDKEAIVAWPGAYSDPRLARVTYRQADEVANRIGNSLLAAGLRRSDRVLLYCENSVEALLTLFGAAKAGLVVAPVNPLLAPDVVDGLIDLVQPAFTIVDAELWERAAPGFERAGLRPDVTIEIGGAAVAGSRDFMSWIAEQPATEPEPESPLHSDDVWSLVFTSGTTSLPKASMATHAYSYLVAHSYALSYTRGLRFVDDLRLLTFLPVIYHCGHNSCVFSAFFTGGTVVLGRRPDPAQTVEAITAERATSVWAGSPAFVEALVDAAETSGDAADLSSLTVVLYAWTALDPAVHDRAVALAGPQLQLVEVFGQTEAMSCFRFWPAQHPEKYRATAPGVNVVGVPTPILGAAIMSPDGDLIREPGVPGEAVYRSPCVTAGYYRDEAATRAAFEHGWFHSGDSCRYDEDGAQVMVDRYKDIVKSGGENVSSIRVEAVLAQHPSVARAAVIGVPHPHWGEAVTGVVQLATRSGAERVTEQELIAFCRERLAGFETPKAVVFVDEMPQTVGGKILKYRLREQLQAAGA